MKKEKMCEYCVRMKVPHTEKDCEYHREIRDKECEYCGVPKSRPNFAYHICVHSKAQDKVDAAYKRGIENVRECVREVLSQSKQHGDSGYCGRCSFIESELKKL